MPTAEQLARTNIDQLLPAARWHLCDYKAADIHAARGVALREIELSASHWRLAPGSGPGRLRGKQDYIAKMVGIVREEFAEGNEFAQKITYRTTDNTPRPFE